MIKPQKQLTYLLVFLIALISILSLTACHKKQQKKTTRIITVMPQASENVLHYSGTIDALTRYPITAPEDGVIAKMNFQYGDILKRDQMLYVVQSDKQQKDFQEALTEFIKAKQTLDTSRAKNQSTQQLFKEGIVSRDERDDTQIKYYSDELAFFQSKDKFDSLLALHQITDFPQLSIADVKTINKLLNSYKKKIERVSLYANAGGIALLPKSDKKSEVIEGAAVKQGAVLLYIGDIEGLSVEIEVNEVNINQLKEGQKVSVTSDVLPNVTLSGYISHINTQALSSGGGNPIFAVTVVVPKITETQRKMIHIGMSADVSIELKHKPQILVPVNAVLRERGQTSVRVMDKDGTIKNVPVTTGSTTEDSVVILSGLKSGDKIVVPN